MTTSMAKDKLHHLVDRLDEVDVDGALDYRWLLVDGDELSPEEIAIVRRGEDEIASGEYVTLAHL